MQKTKLNYEDTSEVKTKDFSNDKIVCKNDKAAHIILNLWILFSVLT